MAETISKEALDLVSALRPFASRMGQRVIDTVMGIAEEVAGPEIGDLELESLGEKAQGLFQDTIETAIALFLIIVALWFSKMVQAGEQQPGGGGRTGQRPGPGGPAGSGGASPTGS
ncbi:MAG: hypothetical protein IMW97_05600 [Firmicutes bacterium]|nr:hypothetical protein [Candidatus Fermentithermobacillaceae bacterium]